VRGAGVALGCVVLGVSVAYAAAPKFDAERLRSLAKLPTVNLQIGFDILTELGFTLSGEPLDLSKLKPPSARVAELRKALTGDERDAERLSDLAGLYMKLGATNDAQAVRTKAAGYFRDRLKAESGHGWWRSQLGRVLLASGQAEEGEKLLQSATELTPRDWQCWEAWGEMFASRALAVLSVTNLEVTIQDGATLNRTTSHPNLTAAEREKARHCYDEAKRCYDQAVAVAPDNIEVYTARMCFRWLATQLLEPILDPTETPKGPVAALAMPSNVLADLKKVAALTTNDVYAIGMAALFDALSDLARQSPQDFAPPQNWSALSESSRNYVRQAMSRLEKLGENPDRATAAGAWASLGVLQFMIVHDVREAESSLRRAVALHPEADKPWDALCLVLVSSGRWEDLASLGKERLKQKPSALVRLMLAKACDRLGNTSETEKQLRAGLELEPGHVQCRLGLIALKLRQPTDDGVLTQIGQAMADMQKSGIWQAPIEQQMDYELLHGIYFALAGQREEAVRHFRRLLDSNPQNETFQQAYEAVGRD
jgi:tetratricopeptide (TPR) repeat protein